jgi:hypothetical protein
MLRVVRLSHLAVVAALASSYACSGAPGEGVDRTESTKKTSDAIIGGSRASAYEESALVSMYQGSQLTAYCSASVIAPKVVLTAGHCVDGFTQWQIKAPYANGTSQSAHASSGITYDWMENGADTVNPNHHDIGLIFLDTAITLASYPQIANTKLANNAQVVNIGRINNGTLSSTDLYVSTPIPVTDGASQGFPFDYSAQEVIQSGDSGGPDEVPGSTPHLIVAVNSGAGGGEVLARVDLLYTWIQGQIASHGGGGGGNPPPPDAGTGNPPPPDAGGGGGGADSGGGGGGNADSGSGGGTGTDSGSGGGTGGGTTGHDAGGGNPDNSSGDPSEWNTGNGSGCAMTGAGTSSNGALAIGLGVLAIGLASRRRRSTR